MREKKTGKVEGGWWTKDNGGSLEAMKEGVNWYEMYKTSKGSKEESVKVPYHTVQEIHTKVEEVMKKQVEQYHKLKKKRASTVDEKWMEDVIKSGTLSDKVAALALKVQASPLHELETLDVLVTMANKKEQRTSQLALEALKDLWIHNLLPDRKLGKHNVFSNLIIL